MNPHFRTALPLAGIFYENNRHLQDMFTACLIDKDSCLNIVKPDPGMDELYAGVYGDADHMFVNANSSSVSVSPKKRKADKSETLIKVVSEKQKKIKGCSKGDVKITRKNNNNSKQASPNASSKEKSKVSEVQKLDYIHVRARRGQATDSHSLAERVRREKISERMKYLQDLVPGCNKITGKAGMLDEIINYVQSLQKQVEFLSMKLATANPELDFNIDDLFTTEFPALGCSLANSAYVDQSNPLDQVVLYRGLDMGINSAEMGLRRSLSTPISIPERFMDSSCYNVVSSDISTLFFQL